ncbi:ALF repeat-containing protein [Solwaraspora sp. WMMD1047]|uniref:ALF repeat-containing protein n=1 Tax=Solwaraspora sp. WMMD1047 TaxID=3016102 RepID=UPI002417FCE2|nr:ALF repeat-containing protein [Solwaraspora sp. WMMD1047]MDG4828284.1 ALF repeat-containing protein [Solwaraspora sp. WMMD1047]
MRWKIPAGILMALAFVVPAAPAAAQPESPGYDESCQIVERKVYQDVRELLTLDLDTADDAEVEALAQQLLAMAEADALPVLSRELQERSDSVADLREFLRSDVRAAWTADLRITVTRTLTDAGTNVRAAADEALRAGTIDAYLAYLNDGLYAARELDCATQPSPTPGATTPAPTPTSSASPGASDGAGGGLPVTGADTGTVAVIGAVLLLLGGAGYLIGRRRRSRFVA